MKPLFIEIVIIAYIAEKSDKEIKNTPCSGFSRHIKVSNELFY